jgi:uncharacterized repeat protein (TIGR03803 family)
MLKFGLRGILAGGVALVALAPFASAIAGSVGTENVVYYFQGDRGTATDGAAPTAGLITDQNGNFYGTTRLGGSGCGRGNRGCGTVFEVPAGGGSDIILYNFTDGADGGNPESTLVMDSSGNLYGTASNGGANGKGVVFEVAPNGTETVLYSFAGGNDGSTPTAGLIVDQNGNLYGTTSQGGGKKSCTGGCGTVFELSPGGTETVLYRFGGQADGWAPMGSLVADSSGNLYGTTEYAGNRGQCASNGCGTVFKLSNGVKTILHTFTGSSASDGANPVANLIFDASGNLYGTTTIGGTGTNCGTPGCGTVFEISSGGAESVLYSFKNYTHVDMYDGATPEGGLLLDGNGNLFGTTAQGGNSSNRGTVFELAPNGTETVLFTFLHGSVTGYTPSGSLIEDVAGNLYGTTSSGAQFHSGNVFQIPAQ